VDALRHKPKGLHRQRAKFLTGGFMDFEVCVKNEILGDSKRIMSMKQLMTYNVCALACAKEAAKDGNPHTWGMWTVSPVKNTEQQVQPDGADKPLAG